MMPTNRRFFGGRMFKSSEFRPALLGRRYRLPLCIALALGHYSAFAVDIAASPTLPVKGHAPTASTPVFVNKSVAGKNPAVDDQIEASYTFTDVDGDTEDPSNGVFQWKADASNIANATTKTFVPTAAQLKKFLTFEATPGTNPLITDPDRADTAVTSPPSGAPVLPSRAQLAAAYSNSMTGMSWGDAYMQCASWGQRLPSVSELQTLFTTYTRANAVGEDSQNDIRDTYGWSANVHWSSSASNDRGTYVYLQSDGHTASNVLTNRYPFACAKSGMTEGPPTITGASVPNAAVGTPVTAAYTYNGNATIPDRSRFQWYTATNATGAGKVIATGTGATTQTYTPVTTDSGKFLMVELTPASYDTVVGTMVSAVSATAVHAATPLVSNVSISGYDKWGTPQIGDTLKGEYTFDAKGGSADASTYRWLGGATSSTSRTYSLTKADRGKTLTFEVTAKNAAGTLGNTQSVASKKRVSIYKLFLKPDKQKYSRMEPPGVPGNADMAEMECRYNGAELPTRLELTTLFNDETPGGTNTELCSKYDWPMKAKCGGSGDESRYWTAEKVSAGKEAYHVNLNTGHVSQTWIGNAFYVACIKP